MPKGTKFIWHSITETGANFKALAAMLSLLHLMEKLQQLESIDFDCKR
jgi:hypothetical protein